jgi:signal transduction histidine kinase/CheY-like chemotaxis protein
MPITSFDPPSPRSLRLFARVVGIVVAVEGGVVLLGWACEIETLKSVVPGLATMKPNTAVALILAGSFLALDGVRGGSPVLRLVARLCAILVALIGGVTGLEYVLDVDLHVDRILFGNAVLASVASVPGRMSPLTAASLLLLGLAALFASGSRRLHHGLCETLTLAVAFISLLALVGYSFGVHALRSVAGYDSMALHTASSLLLLSLGLIASRPERGLMATIVSPGAGGLAARRLLPFAAMLPFVLGRLRLAGERAGLYDTSFGVALGALATAATFSALVLWNARSVNRLEAERRVTEDLMRESSRRLEDAQRRSEELERANQRAQDASRLKSEFLANMSHELRTPLNAVIGFAELLHDGKLGPVSGPQKEYLGDILSGSRHLLALINDVLDLARVEAGKMEFRPEPVDAGRLAREVMDIVRGVAAQKRIRLIAEVEPSLGSIVTDPGKLKQVLYNYLSNALKFTPDEGRVVVRFRGEDADCFRLEVEDTGIGIRREDLGRLFTEFQQLDASTAKKHAGTGLGLVLTKRIVEAQLGRVGVRSEPGQGSLFFAVLPRTGRAEEEPRQQPASSRAESALVLVVEDEAKQRAWLGRALTEAGYSIDVAATGAEALKRCRERAYDAIMLDLLLPDMTGWDLLRAIRGGGPSHETPVIVLTVVAEKTGPGLAVQDFLIKPVQPGDLLASLARVGVTPDRRPSDERRGPVPPAPSEA